MTTPHNPPAWALEAAKEASIAMHNWTLDTSTPPLSTLYETLAAIIAKHAPQPDAPTSGPEARPIGSLNAEEAEAMVDKFNAAPVTAKTGNFVCINEEDGGCSNKKCVEVGYCIDSAATPQPGPTSPAGSSTTRILK